MKFAAFVNADSLFVCERSAIEMLAFIISDVFSPIYSVVHEMEQSLPLVHRGNEAAHCHCATFEISKSEKSTKW